MRSITRLTCIILALGFSAAMADVFQNYEDLNEGFLGTTFAHGGITYHDVNGVGGVFPEGGTFNPGELGEQIIVERATLFYNDFPAYGSPVNALTFGSAFVPGDNLSIGALASVWMDLDELGGAAGLDIAYYENGPWGGITYMLDALRDGQVVATDSFVISNLGGRDTPTFATMSIAGAEFDQLHLYAWYNGQYSGPRGMIDDLAITAVPEPTSLALLALAGLALPRR